MVTLKTSMWAIIKAERDGPSVVILGGQPTAIGGLVLSLADITIVILVTAISTLSVKCITINVAAQNYQHANAVTTLITLTTTRYSHDTRQYQVTGESYDFTSDRWYGKLLLMPMVRNNICKTRLDSGSVVIVNGHGLKRVLFALSILYTGASEQSTTAEKKLN